MKLNFNSPKLTSKIIYAILIQLVLIDIIIVVFLLNGIISQRNSIAKTSANKTSINNTSEPKSTPVPNKTSVPQNTPVPNKTSAPDKTPVPNKTSAPDNTPVPNKTSAPKNTPVPNKTSAPDNTPVPNKTSAPENTPVPNKTSAPDNTPVPNKISANTFVIGKQPEMYMTLLNSRLKIDVKEGLIKALKEKFNSNKNEIRDFKVEDSTVVYGNFIATAYDLSYESCGKYPSNPAYGVTFSGKKAVKGTTIAVDPLVIPLGSNVYIKFPDKFSYLDGWYIAEDIGSKVKGNIIDIFLGESAFKEMENFGSRKINVEIIYPNAEVLALP
jgi:3D (Asp-Asp-Asp) domain-containing protein